MPQFSFNTHVKNAKHLGSCNIQCLNATVYKTFVKKSAKLLGKRAEFTAHPRSLHEANTFDKAELTRLEFSNVNTAPANTIEALENILTKNNHKNIL